MQLISIYSAQDHHPNPKTDTPTLHACLLPASREETTALFHSLLLVQHSGRQILMPNRSPPWWSGGDDQEWAFFGGLSGILLIRFRTGLDADRQSCLWENHWLDDVLMLSTIKLSWCGFSIMWGWGLVKERNWVQSCRLGFVVRQLWCRLSWYCLLAVALQLSWPHQIGVEYGISSLFSALDFVLLNY
jgi:hypothetical protein